jgi:predicted amidophosphoribosyltransferase
VFVWRRYHNVTQHFEVGGKKVELEVLLFDSVIMTGNSDTINADGTITEVRGK